MKAQAAMEYLTTYGWAILIIVVIAALIYLYASTPTTIIPSSCVFVTGAYCNDMVVGTNAISHATTIGLFLTNSQPYPLAKPYLFAQLNGQNTTGTQCSPSYAIAGGSVVCVLTLPTKTTLGQFLAGRLYLNATYCGLNPNFTRSNLCAGAPRETYSGTFQSHTAPLINTNVVITLTAANSTQAADNARDPLIATVDLLGYPLRGATVNFTTNSVGYSINPNYTTTNATGKALSYIWGTTVGNVPVTASYAGVNATTTIQFVPAFGVQFSTSWPYCSSSSGAMVTIDGVAYTCPQLTSSTLYWTSGSVHSCSVDNPVSGGSGVEGQCSIPAGSCTASSNVVIPITCNTLYQLTMSASPSNGGAVSPATGWYNAGNSVSISQSPNSGFDFNGWTGSGAGSYTGPSSTNTLAINAPITETSSYTTNVAFTESGLPSGTQWSVTLNGNQQSSTGTTITFSGLTPGSYSWSTASGIPCGTGCQYAASASSGSISTTSGSAQQGIAYTTQFYLTMSAGTGGTVSPLGGWYNSGQQVRITANPSSGYFFSAWAGTGSGSYSGSTNPYTITVSAPVNESAAFIQGYPVAFQESGLPSGTQWSVMFNGQQASSSNSTITFSNVQIGSYSWSATVPSCGAGCQYSPNPSSGTLSISGQTTQQVTYTTQFYLTMSAGGGGGVSPSSGWYASESTIAISASPSSGYKFYSWTGSGTGSYSGGNSPATITIGSAITESASFAQVPQSYETSLSCAALGQCTCSLSGPCNLCDITYYSGPSCTGSVLSYGSNGGSCYNYDGPCNPSYGSCGGLGCYQGVIGSCNPYGYYWLQGCPYPDYCNIYGQCLGTVCQYSRCSNT